LSIHGLGANLKLPNVCLAQASQAGLSVASSSVVDTGQNVPSGENRPAVSSQLQPSSAGGHLSSGTLTTLLREQEGFAAASGAPSQQALEYATAQAAQSFLPVASAVGGLNVVS